MGEPSIQQAVIDIVKSGKGCWVILKKKKYGVAGYIKSLNQKFYYEIMFSSDKENPFTIFAPNINRTYLTLIDSLAKKNHLTKPKEIFNHVNQLLGDLIKRKNEDIQKELEVLREFYNCHQSGDNLFHQNVLIESSRGTCVFLVNFDTYPAPPVLEMDNDLRKKLKIERVRDLRYFSDWDENNPKPLIALFNELEDRIREEGKIPIPRGSQILDFENVRVREDSPEISCHLVRGQSVGLHAEDPTTITELFKLLIGGQAPFAGKIFFFGEDFGAKCSGKSVREVAKGRPPALNFKTVSAALKYNLLNPPPLLDRRAHLKNLIRIARLEKFSRKKLRTLSDFEVWRVHLVRALYEKPDMLLVSLANESLTRLEIQQAKEILSDAKGTLNCVLVLTGPQELISSCDKVITLQRQHKTEAHNYEKLIIETFGTHKVLSILLRQPDEQVVTRIGQIAGIKLKEERKGEKFRIYSEKDPDDLLLQIFDVAGKNILSFEKLAPTLSDYLVMQRS